MTQPQTFAQTFDYLILGAGSAGLTFAAVAAQLGHKVALFEAHKMGGDCLNYGCVPSKAFIAAAKTGQDWAYAMAHIQQTIAAIAPHDSAERFSKLGVTVIQQAASFVDDQTVKTPDGQRYRGRRILIATGSSPFIPPVPGLSDTPYLTNETFFSLAEPPKELLILGGGPIGIELAQASAKLGTKVMVIEAGPTILSKDDPELVAVVRANLEADGVTLLTGHKVVAAERTGDPNGEQNGGPNGGRIHLTLEANGQQTTCSGTHLLVAAGRQPNVAGLNLDLAHVAYNQRGIIVNKAMRTSNKRIFAAGDVVGPFQFTHMAGYQAGLVIRRSLFGLITTKASYNAVPWVSYTTPELAQIGLNEPAAKAMYGDNIRVTKVAYKDNDRAQTDGTTSGFAKLITTHKGKVLGVSIVGAQAGELITPWSLVLSGKIKLSAMAGLVYPYPTLGDLNRQLASAFYQPSFYSPRTGWISRWLSRLLG